jgi:hypothetical protein
MSRRHILVCRAGEGDTWRAAVWDGRNWTRQPEARGLSGILPKLLTQAARDHDLTVCPTRSLDDMCGDPGDFAIPDDGTPVMIACPAATHWRFLILHNAEKPPLVAGELFLQKLLEDKLDEIFGFSRYRDWPADREIWCRHDLAAADLTPEPAG